MSNCAEYKERIQELEDQVSQFKELVEENTKIPASVSAGPFKHDRSTYYKVETSTGPRVVLMPSEGFFGTKKKVKVGSEVLIVGEFIMDVLPEELVTKKESTEFTPISWEDIGGLRSQIDHIRNSVETPLHNAKLAEELGISPLKGMLIYGPPGCGKTLIAKAIASMIVGKNAPSEAFTYIKGAELLSMYVGATEHRVLSMFKTCREYSKKSGKRAIIFIDEAEALLPRRGSRVSSDVDKTIVPTFLSEMDGFSEHSPILILSTNIPTAIDRAVLREGRIDLKIEVLPPTQEDAEEIFDIHLQEVLCWEKEKTLIQAGISELYDTSRNLEPTGAMIATVVKLSAQQALQRIVAGEDTRKGLVQEDLINAINLIHTNHAEANSTPNYARQPQLQKIS